MRVLVINCGSSSLKYQLIDMPSGEQVFEGLVKNIGSDKSQLMHYGGAADIEQDFPCADHKQALAAMHQCIVDAGLEATVEAVGHRVVHGGEAFAAPVEITEAVLNAIVTVSHLAPLHNPLNLAGIKICQQLFPRLPQVAVFDTAFHQTLPDYAYRYAVPQSWYEQYQVRRYGFHGTSHSNVAQQAAAFLDRPLSELNLITLHLGNGASATAIKNGQSVDTTMGMTPLEGLIMGSRCGDLDAEVPLYLQQVSGDTPAALSHALNKQSGLKGLCGSNNMQQILQRVQQGDDAARLAVDMYCYRLIKTIGAYWAILQHTDAIVFTGGVGENAVPIREQVVQALSGLGVALDLTKNRSVEGDVFEVSTAASEARVLVIDTNEELEIASQVFQLLKQQA